ncbi:MAG: hypothetical protein V4695_12195 [Pseudomonadota bacterium]
MTDKSASTEQISDGWQHAAARLDWTSARFVEEGIQLQPVYGTRYAADFMKNRMIDIDIALRVLLNPAQRRSYSNS